MSSTYSTGPVGPGDGLGNTNVSLLMRCCNSDGLILKPSVPIRAVDNQILQVNGKIVTGSLCLLF